MKPISCSIVLLGLLVLSVQKTGRCERDVDPFNLRCTGPGTFPIPDSCTSYYVCQLYGKFLLPQPAECDPGTIFDESSKECRPPSMVVKPSRCVTVDPSNLPCTGAGTFPIPGSCTSYYVCQPYGKFLLPQPAECDSGTIFDEASKECRPPSMVVKPSRCVGDVADVPSRISSNVETNIGNTPTKTEEVASVFPTDSNVKYAGSCLSLNGLSMCDDISIVNRYSTRVISNPSLRESFEGQEQSIIDAVKYRGDLETAQNNMHTWNNGDSILIGINQIYRLATQYATEFNRKYGLYQGRVRNDVSKQGTNAAFMKMLGDDITKLEKDIKASEDALQSADLPMLKQYFRNNINFLQQELATKQQQLSQEISGDAKAASDLEELSFFTDLVKNDARNIEDQAQTTSQGVQMLLENLKGDSNTFEDYSSAASERHQALSNILSEERQRYEGSVRRISDEIARLDKEIQDKENEDKTLSDANEEIEGIMTKLNQQMEAKRVETNTKLGTKCKGISGFKDALFNPTKVYECVMALNNNSSSPELDEEIKKWNHQRDLYLKNLDKISSIRKEITSKKVEKDTLTKSFPASDSIKQVEAELGRLRVFLTDVDNLKGDLHSSLTSLSEIMKMLQGVECYFRETAEQLTLLTARANTAESGKNKQAKETNIEQDVSRVEAQIQQLSSQLSELKECT